MAYSLGEIDPGNPDAIAGLLEIIRTTEDEDNRGLEAWSLGEIVQTNQEYKAVLNEFIHCGADILEQSSDRIRFSLSVFPLTLFCLPTGLFILSRADNLEQTSDRIRISLSDFP
ncbi:MAG: hypothetical protein ABWU13_17000 [Limnospira maxima]